MADWIAHASEVVRTFMDKGSLADGILMLFLAYGGSFVMIAVHEAGHALAAVLTGNRVRELRVGHSDDVTFAAGSFRLRLGRLRDGEQRGGYVICNAPTATPGQLMIIALAGPGANLLGAAATALPAIRAEGMLGAGGVGGPSRGSGDEPAPPGSQHGDLSAASALTQTWEVLCR